MPDIVGMTRRGGLPLTRDVSFAYALTWLTAGLLLLSSVSGLLYGQRGWYDREAATLPALLGQDAVALIFGLPVLLSSAWLARRGSMRGLLCWMGSLFYVAYFWYFYVIGIQFNPLFPAHIAMVSMSMYAVLYLLFSLDLEGVLEGVKARFSDRVPIRPISGFLITTSLGFAALWLGLIVSSLAAGTELDLVSRYVIAVDGVVLLPLAFFAGCGSGAVKHWGTRSRGYCS